MNMIKRRKAFTLIELLVVIAIIAVLIALLLPAVQQAREAARRTQCKNNLKNIGLALHNYHDSYNTFPPGWVFDPNRTQLKYGGNMWGWNAFLLPMLDQGPLYNTINFNQGFFGGFTTAGGDLMGEAGTAVPFPAQHGPEMTILPIVKCPSDRGLAQTFYRGTGTGNSNARALGGRSNYVGVIGGVPAVNAGTLAAPSYPAASDWVTTAGTPGAIGGTFGGNSKVGLRNMTDGSSNCFVVGEKRFKELSSRRVGLNAIWGGVRTVDPSFTTQFANSFPLAVGLTSQHYNGAVTVNVPMNSLPYVSAGGGTGESNYPGYILSAATNNIGPAVNSAGFYESSGSGKGTPEPLWMGFGSEHNGGAHFLLGDGSVRFVTDNIAALTYAYLGTVADGNIIGDF